MAIAPHNHTPIAIPFHLVGKTIIIEAAVNGQSGYYLLDTGSPDLILNNAHHDELAQHDTELLGFNGTPLKTGRIWAQNVSIGGISVASTFALGLDLSEMERIKNLPIAGIIGHSILKDFAWSLDFECRELMLFNHSDNRQSNWLAQSTPTDSFDLKMSGHIPYLHITLAGKRLRMGLDTGSERNLLLPGTIHEQHFKQRGQLKIAGLTDQQSHLKVGFIHDFVLESLEAKSLEVVLADFSPVNDELPTRLDGILGVAFMQQYKIAINYKKRMVYIWRKPDGKTTNNLATCVLRIGS